jgi:hypothetical protein
MAKRKKTTVVDEPQKPKVKPTYYFTADTEANIVKYNESLDLVERERIYRAHIEKPLDKIAENIINRFKFPYANQSYDDIKRQIVSFLVINLHKYTQEKGKAFSYLSTIAKNYLILHNNNGWKEEKRSIALSDGSNEEYVQIDEVVQLESVDARRHDDIEEFTSLVIAYWDKNLFEIFKKAKDAQVAGAVVGLFRRADTIECFNKKYLYMLIREETDCNTNYTTKIIKKMSQYTEWHARQFFSEGTIDMESIKLTKDL